MTGDDSTDRIDVRADGDRSISTADLTGIAVTGDNPYIDARQILLDRHVLVVPAAVEAPTGLHNLPRRAGSPFVGRQADMDALAETLESGSGVIAQAIAGLGGIGKTELALRHAWAHRGRYRLVWWITADTPVGIEAGLAALAYRLHPPLQPAAASAEAAGWTVGWLQTHPGALIVLDNVEDPAHIENVVGQLDGTHVLVTTRRDLGWQRLGLTQLRLGVLTPGPAIDLLTELTGSPDRDAAAALAAHLGHLPLALDQAAAYITEHHVGITTYQQLLAIDPGRALNTPPEGTAADRAVARVWNLTRSAIQRRLPLAGQLLGTLAWLGPDRLPRDVLDYVADPAGAGSADVSDALALLASYSMITLTDTTVSVHRLVQTITRINPPPGADCDHFDPARHAVLLLRAAIPDDPETNVAGWPRWRALLPHIDALDALIPDNTAISGMAYLLDRAGAYQHGQGQHTMAISKLERAVALDVSTHGPDHPQSLSHNLAVTYREAGRIAEALTLLETILPIHQRVLGAGHHETLAVRHNLANAYRAVSRIAEAIGLFEAVIADYKLTLGADHPTTLLARNNLALAYRDAGRTADAITLFETVLAHRKRVLGPDHPHTLGTRHNLAYAVHVAGRDADAITLFETVLADRERVLGPDHPHTLSSRHNLALVFREVGRTSKAISLLEAISLDHERILGRDHPRTLKTRKTLAVTYRIAGRTTEAVAMLQAVLAEYERVLGPRHHHTLSTRHNLAVAYQAAGRTTEAIGLLKTVLADRKQLLGHDHPHTICTRDALVASYREAGHAPEGDSLHE
jgi:tetratricopeptide (TPR) repeat protein